MKNYFGSQVTISVFLLAFLVSACQGGAPANTSTPEATSTIALTATSAPTDTPAPTNTPAPTPTPDPFFSGNGSLKSGSGQAAVTLRFVNKTDAPVKLSWVNLSGGDEPYGEVAARSTFSQETYSTHAWRIRDNAGNVISEIVATTDKVQVFEIGADQKVVYQPTPLPAPTFGPPVATTERAGADRPDDFPGMYQIHFLYVVPSDGKDQKRDTDGKINKTVEAVNKWFSEQSGGSNLRFDTYQGQLDITYIQLEMTSKEIYDASAAQYGGPAWIRDILEAELVNMNVFQPGKIYVSMFEISKAADTCADAAHPPDLMGRMAGLYTSAVLSDGYGCSSERFGAGTSFTDMGVIHEVVHLLGFASSCGKNPTSSENISHTSENNKDLMWAPKTRGSGTWNTDQMLLDPGNDDYFKHSIPNCPDLANSAFLDPLPANPETPPGWPAEWKFP